ncbi:MAG: hypothetical protein ACLP8A_00350 [Methylovirgula sp.]
MPNFLETHRQTLLEQQARAHHVDRNEPVQVRRTSTGWKYRPIKSYKSTLQIDKKSLVYNLLTVFLRVRVELQIGPPTLGEESCRTGTLNRCFAMRADLLPHEASRGALPLPCAYGCANRTQNAFSGTYFSLVQLLQMCPAITSRDTADTVARIYVKSPSKCLRRLAPTAATL